jgi:hypothetical protein
MPNNAWNVVAIFYKVAAVKFSQHTCQLFIFLKGVEKKANEAT